MPPAFCRLGEHLAKTGGECWAAYLNVTDRAGWQSLVDETRGRWGDVAVRCNIAGPGAREIVLTLAENLELENQALLRGDESILAAVDHGDRLLEMQERLRAASAAGRTVVARYTFDALELRLMAPFGKQDGLSLGVDGTGTLVEETYDAAGNLATRTERPFDLTFVMRRATGARWLNVAVLPRGSGG